MAALYYYDTHRLSDGGITYYEFFGIDIDSKYHRAYDNCRWIREVEPQLDVDRRGIDDTEVSAAPLTEKEKANVLGSVCYHESWTGALGMLP